MAALAPAAILLGVWDENASACRRPASRSTPVFANDTTAVLGTGGLIFVTTDELKMKSEKLFVSPEEIAVTYEFQNLTDQPLDVLVAFPMPDIAGNGDFNVAVPDCESDNFFGFKTTFDGEPVEADAASAGVRVQPRPDGGPGGDGAAADAVRPARRARRSRR